MMLPNPDFNWGNLWADLLKGVGRGLLVHDGSRLAQAALAGLEVFDDAQERRRDRGAEQANGDTYQDSLPKLWSTMLSPEELAALWRRTPEERAAWWKEWMKQNDDAPWAGDAHSAGMDQPPVRPLAHRTRPLSADPIGGWHLDSVLPFGPDGALKVPPYRR
jgi:hypothetical protein